MQYREVALASDAGSGNLIRGNSLFSSGQIGIDLGDDAVTANDSGDADIGPNDLQNYPVITGVTTGATDTTIAGTFNSAPGTSYQLEFFASPSCDASGYGEGMTFIGADFVSTDGSGNASFNVVHSGVRPPTDFITATATEFSTDGATSEFSQCHPVGAVVQPAALSLAPDPLTYGSQAVGSSSAAMPVTLTNTGGGTVVVSSFSLTGGNSRRNFVSLGSPWKALAPLLGRNSFIWSRPPASAFGWNTASR